MKILLVDDDPSALRLSAALLKSTGHEVMEASDGEQAWEMLQTNDIGLVVSDWLMPNVSGIDLCRRIRKACFDRYVYLILCTGKAETSDLIEGMDAGADDFLVKPISREELRVGIRAGERILDLERGLEKRNRELAEANGYLERAYKLVSDTNHRLQEAHKLIDEDLEAAAWLQKTLLPSPLLQANKVHCRWHFQPSRYVAGDILNLFELAPDLVGFYMLDVSGHGVPAAMLSVSLSMLLTPEGLHGSPLKEFDANRGTFEVASPTAVVKELNRRFQSKADQYFTLLYGVLDTRAETMTIAQAGHPNPILLRAHEEPKYLGSGGMPVGILPEIEFDCVQVPFHKGDRLILYSDGVTECPSPEGEPFGAERLLTACRSYQGKPLAVALEGIAECINEWKGGRESQDDISIMCIEFVAENHGPQNLPDLIPVDVEVGIDPALLVEKSLSVADAQRG